MKLGTIRLKLNPPTASSNTIETSANAGKTDQIDAMVISAVPGRETRRRICS
jgi:hypothetical protein